MCGGGRGGGVEGRVKQLARWKGVSTDRDRCMMGKEVREENKMKWD